MSTEPHPLSGPPQIRSATGTIAQHFRLATRASLMLHRISGGAIDVSDAADGSDTIASILIGGVDLLGGATVTWDTDDTTFAALIAAAINAATGHNYWATSATDHVHIWPKSPWKADTGAITVDDTSFTATVANMNIEQAFAAGIRVRSGFAANIPATSMYALGFDHSIYSGDTGVAAGYVAGADTRVEIDGRPTGRFNIKTAAPVYLFAEADQICNFFDMGGGFRAVAADTERRHSLYNFREFPTFLQAAAAAAMTYDCESY